MLIRPQNRAVQIIQKPIAIWANDRHIPGCVQQLRLQISARRILGQTTDPKVNLKNILVGLS